MQSIWKLAPARNDNEASEEREEGEEGPGRFHNIWTNRTNDGTDARYLLSVWSGSVRTTGPSIA